MMVRSSACTDLELSSGIVIVYATQFCIASECIYQHLQILDFSAIFQTRLKVFSDSSFPFQAATVSICFSTV